MAISLYSKQLLESNICPSEDEEVAVRGHLSELTSKSALVDAEIAQLLARLHSLQRTRSALEDDIALHQPVISAARRIPFEILEQILFHCLPETRNPTMSTIDAPLKYARVCSYWRSVIYQAPRLWTRLHLAIPSPLVNPVSYGGLPFPSSNVEEGARNVDIDIARRRIQTARKWLDRALHYPVSISVACGPCDNVLCEVLDVLWDTILEFSEQWADIEIELPMSPHKTFDRLKDVSPETTPHLRSIRLRCLMPGGFAPITQDSWFQTKLMLAPRLESLHLIGLLGAHNIDIAWSQITELTIENCGLLSDEAQRILIESPNIRRCRLHVTRSALPTQPTDSPIICLVHLESFTLLERGPFTAKVRAPNLKRLTYEAYRSGREHFDIFELITDQDGLPTGHSLEGLTFDPTTTPPETVVQFLALTPNVKYLSLEVPSTHLSCVEWKWTSRYVFGDAFLSALMPMKEQHAACNDTLNLSFKSLSSRVAFCHKLERFICTSRAGFTDAALLSFIRSRLNPSCTGQPNSKVVQPDIHSCRPIPLRQIFVKFDRPAEVDIFAELRNSTQQSAGLDLRLAYKEPSKPSTSPGQLSPWNGIRSREAVPECITWVAADEASIV